MTAEVAYLRGRQEASFALRSCVLAVTERLLRRAAGLVTHAVSQ
jgi:hypothetical protein